MKCVTDLLGDLNDKPQLSYNEVMALQELGVEEGLAQRLRAYQVLERLLTDDSSQFEKRILNVLAGASYCEDTGGASGCFLKGQALNYLSEAVITAAYVSLGLRSANENGKIGGAEGAKRGTGARFADQAKLDDHFNRHGADFGATSSTQYQQMADDFLTGSRGV